MSKSLQEQLDMALQEIAQLKLNASPLSTPGGTTTRASTATPSSAAKDGGDEPTEEHNGFTMMS